MLVIPSADTEQEHRAVGPRSFLKGLGIAGASLLPASADTLRRRLYLGFCLLSIGTAAAMGSGSGGSSGSVESNPLQQEVGSSAFKVYNQGVDLMRAKKFAAAQIKFEQAIRDNPDFAEAHNNLGFTLGSRARRTMRKPLNITIRLFNSNRIWRRHMSIEGYSLQRWARNPTRKKTWLLLKS
jgi:hypothetical protein